MTPTQAPSEKPAREFYLTRGNDHGPDQLTHICLFEYYPQHNPLVLVEKSAYDQQALEIAEWKERHETVSTTNRLQRMTIGELQRQRDENQLEIRQLKENVKLQAEQLRDFVDSTLKLKQALQDADAELRQHAVWWDAENNTSRGNEAYKAAENIQAALGKPTKIGTVAAIDKKAEG